MEIYILQKKLTFFFQILVSLTHVYMERARFHKGPTDAPVPVGQLDEIVIHVSFRYT